MIVDLVDEFRALTQALQDLRQHLMSSQPTHYYPLTDSEESLNAAPLTLACDLISDLWYQGDQDGRETRARHGLILADESTIHLINTVNEQKDRFRSAVNAEKQQLDKQQWADRQQQLSLHGSKLRESLSFAGLQRVHLKQCYRHIPLIVDKPIKVGFSWYNNGRSIKKISHHQAQQFLLELGEDKSHIQAQLQTLGKLSAKTQLAQMQLLAPQVRGNLLFKEKGNQWRKAMNISLPLFIPAKGESDNILPSFNHIPLSPPNGRTRQARTDNKL